MAKHAKEHNRKREARFVAAEEEHTLIAQAAENRNLKPATYMRAIVLRQAKIDARRSA